MKKLLPIILLLFSHSMMADTYSYEVINKSQLNKTDLYEGINHWLNSEFIKVPKSKTSKDREDGIIISSGRTQWNMVAESWMPDILLKSRFKLKAEVKDNKYRLTFYNVGLDWLGDNIIYENIELSEKRDKNQTDAGKAFEKMASNLNNHLLNYKPKDDW